MSLLGDLRLIVRDLQLMADLLVGGAEG